MTPSRPSVLAPAVLLFGIMVAHALLETARDALFLARLGPHLLASAYLTIAVVALLAVGGARRWGGAREPRRVLVLFLGIAAVGTALLAAMIPLAPSFVFVLYVWTGLMATLVVPSFWTLIDHSLRVSEAKRVFAMIGAGGVLGAMVGSALAGLLGRVISPHHLVTAGAIAFGATALVTLVLAPQTHVDELPPARKRVDVLSRHSRHYVRLLIVVGVISTVTLTLADLTFKRVLAERFAADDLATAFGAIYTLLNFVGLVIQLAVTPKLLSRWGVGGALTVLPLVLVASATGFALTGALIAIIALKLGDGGFRHSLHRVASEILYLPVPSLVRDGWKPIADAISQRGGQALAALLWFALASLAGAQLLAVVVAAMSIAWLFAVRVAKHAYVRQFRDTLQAGEIERNVRVPALDGDSIALLTEALAQPQECEALAALELLARGGRVPALVLYHPSQAVVRRALALLDNNEQRADVAQVLRRLITHADPKIRAAALIAASRQPGHHDELQIAATDADPDVRAAALVGLADDPMNARIVDEGVAALQAGACTDRVALAHAIRYAPHERFRRTLYELLALREPAVMREVLRVLARAPQLAEVERLLPLLETPHARGDVRRVFTAIGRPGLSRLILALDDPRTPIGVRRHLPRTISRFHARAAADALVARLLREPDGTTEFKILRALGRMRTDDPHLPLDPIIIREYVRRSIADAARYATFLDGVVAAADSSPSAKLMTELLCERRRWAIEHAFRALGILHPCEDLHIVYDALLSGSDTRRGAAREIVEAIVPVELRATLFAVLDELSPSQRRARLGDLAPGPFPTYEALLAALLADPSESLKCVVAHHVAERHLVALRHDLTRLRPVVGPPLVIYAFDQAIARLDA